MKKILALLKSLIRFGKITNPGADDRPIPMSQFQYFNKVKDVIVIYPYGFSANAPLDNLAVLMNVGHEDNSVAFPFSGGDRVKNLKPGEVVVGNFVSGSFVKFSQNGDIDINGQNDMNVTVTGEVTITAPSGVTINGDLQVNGDINSTGNLDVDGTIDGGATITAVGALAGASIVAGGVTGSGGTLAATIVTAGSVSLSSHVHTGVTSGGSNTGGPV